MRKLIIGLVLLGAIYQACADDLIKLAQIQAITLQGVLPNQSRFSLRIEIKPQPSSPEPKAAYWGADGGPVRNVISKLELKIDDTLVPIPAKAFGDLGNINLAGGVALGQVRDGYKLHIQGGDAAGSYSAILTFTKNSFIKREIKTGE